MTFEGLDKYLRIKTILFFQKIYIFLEGKCPLISW